MKTLSKFELLQMVQSFYEGPLDIETALKIFEIRYGFKPEVVEDEDNIYVNEDILSKFNKEYINIEIFKYLKRLQMSGVVNMAVGNVQSRLMHQYNASPDEAQEIHNIYLTHYSDIYMSHKGNR